MPSAGWREVAAALDAEAEPIPDDPGNSGEGPGGADPCGPGRCDGHGPAASGRCEPMTANDDTPDKGQDGDGSADERTAAEAYSDAFGTLAAERVESVRFDLHDRFAGVRETDFLVDGAATLDQLRRALDDARAEIEAVAEAHPSAEPRRPAGGVAGGDGGDDQDDGPGETPGVWSHLRDAAEEVEGVDTDDREGAAGD